MACLSATSRSGIHLREGLWGSALAGTAAPGWPWWWDSYIEKNDLWKVFRPLADFLPTITIKAKDFANEITNFNIKQNALDTESRITREHVKNNEDVRRLLVNRGIVPERLPPAEDVKKVERRLVSEQKKLPRQTEPLQGDTEAGD